ncbi:tetratricopeptide repeat protein [Apibacter sp. HY039]|uniref:tetratricopeptide repeat protein n=1 Tax=Apibacter sp. HY039 TaxID=2501476 RepID=UPI0013E29178|nr:tetratricopeptide repeat protein [Apibacter sp. HY039]
MKKWISNFVNGSEDEIYTEVENDIKEVGKEYRFTQLKCYTSSFSLNSEEIKKTLFDFFILYLKYKNEKLDPVFYFTTNSSIKKNEKLLSRWVDKTIFHDDSDKCVFFKRIKKILIDEIKKIKENKLKFIKENLELKKEINDKYNNIKYIIDNEEIVLNFTKTIHWGFGEQTTEESIKNLREEIFSILANKKFKNRSVDILFRVLLSEIYRCSQESEISNRCLNKIGLEKILSFNDEEVSERVNNKFILLMGVEIDDLKNEIQNLQKNIENINSEIKELKPKQIKKNLTLLPNIDSNKIFGWEEEIKEAERILSENKVIAIYNIGGFGKTTFVKKLLSLYYEQFKHIIWLSIEKSIQNEFVLNQILLSNLDLKLNKKNTLNQQFKFILNELNRIGGNNVLILDIQKDVDDPCSLNEILSLNNWKIIIISRNYFKSIVSYKLPNLKREESKKIFSEYCTRIEIDDLVFNDFLEYVSSNNLIVELVAKTIENSFDLTLEFFLESLKKQNLNQNIFKIDIELQNELIQIFDYILQKFTFEGLSTSEKSYLKFLSLLPSTNIIIKDIVLICGKEYYESNKIEISNWINGLERKGFIEYEDGRKSIRIHKIIQDSVLYSIQKEKFFFPFARYIIWLSHRLREGYNSPNKSFKYLKYAESILNSIKEEYRSEIYLPLLVLENEYLHLSSFFYIRENIEDYWKDLIKRTDNYVLKDDISLATMYNNLALSLNTFNDIENIIKYLKKSVYIYYGNLDSIVKENKLLVLITVLNNLSQAYIYSKDVKNALKYFVEVLKIREKYNFYRDSQVGVGYNILAELYSVTMDFDKSILLIEEAIKYHNMIPVEDRNDGLLMSYYNQLSKYSLLKDDLNRAITYQEECIKILEDLRIKNKQSLYMYEYLNKLYKASGREKDIKSIYNT